MCPSHGERRNGECAMRHKNISPADATDRHRNHAGCLSTTQIAPPVRRIGTDISQAERDVENVECGVLDVGCGMWNVGCEMLGVERGMGHAPREYFSHRSTLFWSRITKSYKWKGQCLLSALPPCNENFTF